MSKKLSITEFIEKSKLKHGYKYNYSESVYVNTYTKVKIICPIHGIFEQKPQEHFKHGCKKCSYEIVRNKNSNDIKKFIEKSNLIHKNKYNYDFVNYKNNTTKVIIICPIHGKFLQRPLNHITGQGCRECGNLLISNKLSSTTEEFIEKSKKIHKDKYDYSLVNYINNKINVKIICPKHGEFEQTPDSHLFGKGCIECKNNKLSIIFKLNIDEFIKRANNIHDFKYDYSKIEYYSNKIPIKIICPTHGEFLQRPDNHLQGYGCKTCSSSKGELLIAKYLSDNNIKFEQQKSFDDCKNILPLKFDFYLPELNILIEFQGKQHFEPQPHFGGNKTFGDLQKRDKIKKQWCIDNKVNLIEINYNNPFEIYEYDFNLLKLKNYFKLNFNNNFYFELNENIEINYQSLNSERDKNYNLDLLNNSNKKVITIFEDNLIDKFNIVISRLNNLLDINEKIFARKCHIKELSNSEYSDFLISNHIQGNVNTSIKLGLYYNNELFSVMGFSKYRINMGRNSKNDCYELTRFCTKLGYSVIGGASKLLKHFINLYNPNEIISYADRNWSNGNLYEKLGFEFQYNTQPNYYYVDNNKKRINRFKFRKSELIKQGFDFNKSESEIMNTLGYSKVYDCGSKLYKLLC